MPDHRKVREHRHLQFFGDLLHDPCLWHLSRHSVSKAFAIGLFFAWMPVPFQMVLAAGGAIVFHGNLPLSVVLVWLTNPITMAPMFYGAYKVGVMILGEELQAFDIELSWQWLQHGLSQVWEPFLLGCLVVGTFSSMTGYLATRFLWRWMVLRKWRKRHALSNNS